MIYLYYHNYIIILSQHTIIFEKDNEFNQQWFCLCRERLTAIEKWEKSCGKHPSQKLVEKKLMMRKNCAQRKKLLRLYLAEAFAAEGFEEWVTQNWQEVAGCKASGGFTSEIWGCYICQEGANVFGVFGRKVSVEEFAHI